MCVVLVFPLFLFFALREGRIRDRTGQDKDPFGCGNETQNGGSFLSSRALIMGWSLSLSLFCVFSTETVCGLVDKLSNPFFVPYFEHGHRHRERHAHTRTYAHTHLHPPLTSQRTPRYGNSRSSKRVSRGLRVIFFPSLSISFPFVIFSFLLWAFHGV
jgi:hypothetical protein